MREPLSTPLHNITTAEEATDLLMYGFAPRTVDEGLDTPLHVAPNALVAAVLIAAGGDPNAENAVGLKPLNFARDGDIATVLLANGADVKAPMGIGGFDLLHCVTKCCVASAMVAFGADVNKVSYAAKRTPLFFARSLEMSEVFVGHGAEVDAADVKGETPLMAMCKKLRACDEGCKREKRRVIEYLAMSGACMEVMDSNGNTIEDLAGRSESEFILSVRQRVAMKQMADVVDARGVRAKMVEEGDFMIVNTLGVAVEIRALILQYV